MNKHITNAKQTHRGRIMGDLQYINDSNGKPLFVILPFEKYQEMTAINRFAVEGENELNQWESVQFESGENDEETIPNEVLNIMLDDGVSLLAAWRIYRRFSQYDVAEKTGLTQSAISQAERKDSKPQKKTLERLAVVYGCSTLQLTL